MNTLDHLKYDSQLVMIPASLLPICCMVQEANTATLPVQHRSI